MKNIILMFCVCLGMAATYPGNDLTYKKVESREFAHVLNGFTVFGETFTDKISVRVLSVYDETGINGVCDKSTSLYVAVSNFEDCPGQSVFKIQGLAAPKFIRWYKDDAKRPMFQIEYGPYNKRKTAFVKSTLQGLVILDKTSF
ncbi:MAG: hypothetical protein NTX03_14550 [Bacteroidetes bacterium]|nr:hypothetical protein [Bacteroidota bacterium]